MSDERRLTERVLRRVAELPDRTSPDDWPEAMLVTHDELERILREELAAPSDTSKRPAWPDGGDCVQDNQGSCVIHSDHRPPSDTRELPKEAKR